MFGKNDQSEIKLVEGSNTSSLIGAVLVVVGIIAFVVFAKPMGAEVSTMATGVEAKQTEVAGLKAKLSAYGKAEADLNLSTAVKKQEVLSAIPSKLYQDAVIEDLIKIADEYKVDLRSISFSKGSTEVDGISALRISSSFEGNYSDLTSFLTGIEQNARLFKVENIAVQIKKVDVADIERANFSLSIVAFYQDNK